MKVIISQPSKQYVHQLCIALQRKSRLKVFFTSIWYKPNALLFKVLRALPIWKIFLENIFKKRYHPELNENKICLYPLYEIFRQLFKAKNERWVFCVERKHDKYVASQINGINASIFIGYEKASLNSFNAARKKGMITILDLAQVHYNHIKELRSKYPIFAELMPRELFDQISDVKEKEFQLADYVLTLSSYSKKTLVEAGMTPKKIFTVNLGFDPIKFTPKKKYRKEGEFKILFVGTITRRKGIHLLLRAFQELALAHAKLIIVGPVLDAQDILDQYHGLYSYYPFMHHDILADQYRDADIFVFPSYLDSWAMTVLEAMACGTPVIVSEHTGSKDAVQKGGGFIIPVNNVDAVKKKISFLYENREFVEIYGKKATEIAAQYTWNNYYNRINEIIDSIIANNKLVQ